MCPLLRSLSRKRTFCFLSTSLVPEKQQDVKRKLKQDSVSRDCQSSVYEAVSRATVNKPCSNKALYTRPIQPHSQAHSAAPQGTPFSLSSLPPHQIHNALTARPLLSVSSLAFSSLSLLSRLLISLSPRPLLSLPQLQGQTETEGQRHTVGHREIREAATDRRNGRV
jgi:hypothetical protein